MVSDLLQTPKWRADAGIRNGRPAQRLLAEVEVPDGR